MGGLFWGKGEMHIDGYKRVGRDSYSCYNNYRFHLIVIIVIIIIDSI